ncbi:hypothetical protein [Pseudoxanthomonas sacheonensis]|uniref:Dicarboxylate transport n=1 Tax=Pseudoxanthomonas sacheonensis TaxID=443615 RepID=A0ABU1RTZ1_9GAMM|nr:hypothetical protein [Pseudoxanthomonas sacheonensis]MDR6842229.1 hypothetical protein [Pseudoxanthomonas sacheonensis]
MPRRILPLLLLPLLTMPVGGQARTLSARIAKVVTPVANLQEVTVRLEWPAAAESGQLTLTARRMVAPDLGYRFDNLTWRCPLQRIAQPQGWRCEGEIRSAGRKPLKLGIDLATASTDAVLTSGRSKLALHRNAAAPDITRIDLTRVPLAWAQALLAQAWSDANLKAGQMSGSLNIHTPDSQPLRVEGRLAFAGLGLDTPDGSIAAEGLGAQVDLDYRKSAGLSLVTVDGSLRGGEMLVGNGYIALPATPVEIRIAARQQGESGWEIPQLLWNDGNAMRAQGSLGFDAQTRLRDADIQVESADMAPLRPRYLSGWLGLFGLSELQLHGAMSAQVQMRGGELVRAAADLREVSVIDAQQRFRFDGLSGTPVFSAGAAVDSDLRWRGGEVHGLTFGAANLPLDSVGGSIGLREAVTVPMLGGGLRFEDINLRPPAGERGLEFDFGLTVEGIDVGQLAKALDWPAFQGRLDGRIPKARYANDRLDFDGTLVTHMFDGTVQVSGLAMERPFGTAPTLSADIEMDDMNLQSLTEVFGFGEITGALDGSIRNLRLVDWKAEGFAADLHTDPNWKGRRRISQRAVQDLSSVGGAGGLGDSLQAQALKLFDDFGYRQIGIRCRLAEEVCDMDGLRSAGKGFIIVEGSGLPRLTVVGFNHRVDWLTLVERLVAVTQGESKPVIE